MAGSVFRFLVGVVIATLLVFGIAPSIGIPRSHLLPPALVYKDAQGKSRGVITKKEYEGTRNPFVLGQMNYFLHVRFPAPAPPNVGVKNPGKPAVYTGEVRVDKEQYNAAQIGEAVPIRYEKTHPDIHGINATGAGRNEVGAGAWISGYLMYWILIFVLGYALTPLLERIWPRGNM